jgi:succinoglycan biosynthesis transport protein ExoP
LSYLHPLSIVRTIWKRKTMVLVAWTLGSAIAAAIVWYLPTVYTAEAVVLVDSQKIPERYVASTVSTDVQDRLATISQQILSTTHLKKIIDEFDLYKRERRLLVQEEILELMRQDVSINLEKGWVGNRTGAFRIGYQGPEPATVAQVANRLANLYIEENLKVREVQAEGTSEFMSTQLQEAKKRLDALEAQVSDYKVKYLGELPEQQNAISSDLSRATLDLQGNAEAIRRAEESRLIMQNTLSVAEASLALLMQPASAAPALGGPRPQRAAPAPKGEADQVRAKIDALLGRYGEKHPDVQSAREELGRVAARERETGEVTIHAQSADTGGVEAATVAAVPAGRIPGERDFQLGQAQERVVALRGSIGAISREIEARKNDDQKIRQSINALQGRLGRLPLREQDLARITRDYEISKANYKMLLDKSLNAEMATDMEHRQKSERFTLIDPARIPELPARPNRRLLGGAGCLVSLCLGLVLAFAVEGRKGAVLGEWEIPEEFTILARLPNLSLPSNDRPPSRPHLRVAVVSSAVGLFLAAAAAGLYMLRGRL